MPNRVLQTNEQLRQALDIEEAESRKLERQLKECQNRIISLQDSHHLLEQRYDGQQDQLDRVLKELKETKKTKNEMETTLSQELVHHMNEKEKWLDKEAELSEKLEMLKSALDAQSIKSKEQATALSEAQSAQTKLDQMTNGSKVPATAAAVADPKLDKKSVKELAAANKTIERLRGELEMVHQQMEMVSKEYALRHDTVKKEVEQLRGLNSRLQEENEGFQVLLAQKTVLGGFSSLADELEDRDGDSEQDEEDSVARNRHSTGSDSLEPNQSQDQKDDDAEDENSRDIKKRIYDLEFETRALKNHNKALKLSLERLVQRLLEYREFEAVVHDEQKVPQRSLSLFHERVSHKHSGSISIPQYAYYNQQGGAPVPPPKDGTGGSPVLTGSPQKLPRRRMHAHSPSVQSIQSVSSVASSMMHRFRPIRSPVAWNNMILANGGHANSIDTNVNGSDGVGTGGSGQGPVLMSATSMLSDVSSDGGSSATSAASNNHDTQDTQHLEHLLNDSSPIISRRTTSSQKKLRPLRLVSPENGLSNPGGASQALPSAGSASSGGSSSWGLGLY